MGCQASSVEQVITPAKAKRMAHSALRRSGRSTGRFDEDDIATALVKHHRVENINDWFEFIDVVGQGHFGCVKRAISRNSGKEWAVKQVDMVNIVDREALRNEIEILRRLHHPNIVRVISSYEDDARMYMVMQLCKGKELYEHVYKEHRQFTEDEVKRMVRALLRAVAFLHSNYVTHRDLKLENLLLEQADRPGSLKLCDFGLSARFRRGEKLQASLGTIDYVAPEVLDGEYNEKCDLWSVGVICYELLTKISPFHAATVDATMDKIFDGKLVFQDSVWKKYSPQAIMFIKALVKEDVNARLSAEQALRHPWLQGLDKDEEESERLRSNKKLLLTNMLNFSQCRKFKQTAMLSVALGVSDDCIHHAMAAEVFHSIDTGREGTITRQEFINAMVECGISKDAASDLFSRINQSKSGRINFLEFIASAMDQRDIGQNTIKEAFGLLDGEEKGRLSIVGLQDVFKNALVDEEVREMISSADTKGDGYVDFESFEAMFRPDLAVVEERSSVPSNAASEDTDKHTAVSSEAGMTPSVIMHQQHDNVPVSTTQVGVTMTSDSR